MNSFELIFQGQKDHFRQDQLLTSAKQRIKQVNRIRKWIYEHRSEIYQALLSDLGKCESETNLAEIRPVLKEIRKVNRYLSHWLSKHRVDGELALLGSKAYYRFEPMGQVLIISPWNYPFLLAVKPLISALAAGNTVIVKPSELSPTTSKLIKEMVMDLFPEKLVSVCTGGGEVSKDLLTLPFNHIYFTGSPAIGKLIMKAASNHLASITLELGGQNPAIIDQTANLKHAAEKLCWGKFFNAGQSCVAPNTIYVHENVYQDFVKEFKRAIVQQYGDTKQLHENADYGRIVSQEHFNRLRELFEKATFKEGFELEMTGDWNVDELFIGPSLMTKSSYDSLFAKEEIFGPLVPVQPYSDKTMLVDFLGEQEKPLCLYVFSNKRKEQQYWLERVLAGTACINDVLIQFSHPHLPFGGSNNSGIGKSHGFEGFKSFSNQKSVVKQRVGLSTTSLVRPPFRSWKKKLVWLLTRYF